MSVSHRHFTTLLPALCSGLCRPSCVSAVFRCSPSAHRHFAYLGNWQGLESASRRSLVPAGWCLQRFWRVCLPTRWHSFGIIRATNFSSTGLVPPRIISPNVSSTPPTKNGEGGDSQMPVRTPQRPNIQTIKGNYHHHIIMLLCLYIIIISL